MAAALVFRSPPFPWNLRSVPDARGLVPLRSAPPPPPPPPPLVSGRLFFPLHMESCAPTLRSLASRCRCHGGGPERQWLEKRDESDQDEILEGEIVRTLLIDNYDSYTYNIYQELSVVNGVPPVVIRNDEWTWDYIYHCLYEKRAFDNIVISPGPGTPACPNDVSAYKYFMIANIFQYWASALATRPWDWFMVLMLSMLLSRFMDVSVKSSMAIAIFSIKYLQELDLALRLFGTIHL